MASPVTGMDSILCELPLYEGEEHFAITIERVSREVIRSTDVTMELHNWLESGDAANWKRALHLLPYLGRIDQVSYSLFCQVLKTVTATQEEEKCCYAASLLLRYTSKKDADNFWKQLEASGGIVRLVVTAPVSSLCEGYFWTGLAKSRVSVEDLSEDVAVQALKVLSLIASRDFLTQPLMSEITSIVELIEIKLGMCASIV